MKYRLLKTVILVAFPCCFYAVYAGELICRSKDKSGITLYEPCGENPDPSTVVDAKITITMPSQPAKPAVEKNPYFPDLKIEVKPPSREETTPPADTTRSDDDVEEDAAAADTETSKEELTEQPDEE